MTRDDSRAASRPRRLLLVTHVIPYPASAGNELRIYRLLLWLKDLGFEVVLLVAVPATSMDTEQERGLRGLVYRLHTLPAAGLPSPYFARLHNGMARMRRLVERGLRAPDLGARWWQVRERTGQVLSRLHVPLPASLFLPPTIALEEHLGTPEIVAASARLSRKYRPTVVLVEYVFMTRCLQNLPPGTLKVVDCHDVFSRRAEKVMETTGIIDTSAITARQESEMLDRADLILAIQPEECRELQALAPSRTVITVGVDLPVRKSDQPPRPARVLCVASDNNVNVQSLQEFVDQAWPRIVHQCPDATLQIVGKAARRIQSDHSPAILRSGFVENLDAAYAEAAVVINPVDAGTGLKIKTVEALAHGKALVTFGNGVDGLPAASPPPFRIATDWPSFAAQTAQLLHEPAQRQLLEQQAVDFARQHFGRDVVYSEFAQQLEQWCARQSLS